MFRKSNIVKIISRSAITGKVVTKGYDKPNPKITVTETIKKKRK